MSGADESVPPQKVRVLQIIASALIVGVVVMTTIFLAVTHDQPAAETSMISLISVGMLVVMVLTSVVLPNILVEGLVRGIAAGKWPPQGGENFHPADHSTDAARLLLARQTSLIVTLALLESAAMFGGVAFLVERHLFTLAVVGTAVVFMMANFPTQASVQAWVGRQLARLAELRQTGPQSK